MVYERVGSWNSELLQAVSRTLGPLPDDLRRVAPITFQTATFMLGNVFGGCSAVQSGELELCAVELCAAQGRCCGMEIVEIDGHLRLRTEVNGGYGSANRGVGRQG